MRRYWDVVLEAGERRVNADTAAEEFRALFEESIALHRISDVPLGVLLSGGIDSASVTGMLARLSGRVKTFTVGFDAGATEGELAEARAVARHFGTDHHEIIMGPALADALPGIVRMQDEPLADPAAIADVLHLSVRRSLREGRPHRRRVPTRLLGGYPRYGWLRVGRAAATLAGRDVGGRRAAPGRCLTACAPRASRDG